jgi:2-polyprenyl-3-methyl-5-hydroxy-6-metoxy-1,4-benzoquinol methylase
MPEALATCPICAAAEFDPVEPFADARITTAYTACRRCGLVAMNPRPTAAEQAAYYGAEYWTVRAGDDEAKRRKQARRAGFIVAFLERHLRAGPGEGGLASRTAVLEVGSSFGMTLLTLKDRIASLGGSPTLYGIEPSEHAVACSQEVYRSIRVIGRSWEDLRTTEEGPFDLVILSHVLEHLDDPVAGLVAIRRRMAPTGALFIEVPNYYGHPSVEYAHNYCFTETSLRNTLDRAGLAVKALEVNGHDEDFPFYLTCLAAWAETSGTVEPEPLAVIQVRRTASQEAFRELRRRRPRPE